jgi:hypothetical protein
MDFETVDFGSFANSQHFVGIVRGEITAPADFQPASFQVPGLPRDSRPDCIGVRLVPQEANSEPVVVDGHHVLENHGWSVVNRYQHIHGAIVVEVADRQASCGKSSGEMPGPLMCLRPPTCFNRCETGERVPYTKHGWNVPRSCHPDVRWRSSNRDCRHCRNQQT